MIICDVCGGSPTTVWHTAPQLLNVCNNCHLAVCCTAHTPNCNHHQFCCNDCHRQEIAP